MPPIRLLAAALAASGMLAHAGCGTTRSTDTSRTATEQILVSDAIDRTVQRINVIPLAGHKVFLDNTYLEKALDKEYLISSLRQHLVANGCILTEKREDAMYILEARAGSIGTNRSEVLYGVPAVNLPMTIPGVPSAIPEIPVMKRTNQRGVAKVAVFAYHRESGTPVWQSGLVRDESTARDWWILGGGPLQHGTIYEEATFAGSKIPNPLHLGKDEYPDFVPRVVRLDEEKTFVQRQVGLQRLPATQNNPPERTAEATNQTPSQ
jgi:hypothetical protein